MARSGDLHVTKECSAYKGLAGDFCTITSSSLEEIEVGSKVVYAEAAEGGSLDTDVVLDAGSGNTAAGHVKRRGDVLGRDRQVHRIPSPGRCLGRLDGTVALGRDVQLQLSRDLLRSPA